jgi:hypothetical protein|tara:strand:+ start:1545 stop:1991 length:447 start_codon:yes stop_codon:yes gene_type:complete
MNTYLFVSDRGPVAFVEGTDNTLNDLQRLVDGFVEVQVTQHGEDAWFNEEGTFRKNFFQNNVASFEVGIPLVGPVVFTRSNELGETTGLTDADIRRWAELLEMDENEGTWFESDEDQPWTMPIEPVSIDYVVKMMEDLDAALAAAIAG